MPRKKIIIGIHGLGNKPEKDLLEKWWRMAIKEGLGIIGSKVRRVPFKIVYWADILHPEPLNPEIRERENPLYLDEPYVNADGRVMPDINEFQIKILNYLEGQIDKIFLNDDLSINFKDVTDIFIHRYFKDLAAYYGDRQIPVSNPNISAKDAIQYRLRKILKKYKEYEIFLIAHSMGSIVAFDVLWKYSKDVKVNTLITIGSPLGLPVVVARVYAEQKMVNSHIKKPHAPDSVKGKWFNISDLTDRIALDHTLEDDYGSNSTGVAPEDIMVINNYGINEIRNPHKSYGYLRTPEFAVVVNEFLKRKGKSRAYKYLSRKIIYGMDVIKEFFKDIKK